MRLEASTDGRELTLDALDAAMGQRRLSARGRSSLALPLADATLDVELEEPVTGVRAATVHLALDRGVLRVDLPHSETAAGPVVARLEIPLGALARMPELAEAMRTAPVVKADGPVHLQLWAPQVDTCAVLQALSLSERPERAIFRPRHRGLARSRRPDRPDWERDGREPPPLHGHPGGDDVRDACGWTRSPTASSCNRWHSWWPVPASRQAARSCCGRAGSPARMRWPRW